MQNRLMHIRERIARAAAESGRAPGKIQLVAVSKTVTPDDIRRAFNAGQRLFGESYIQEAAGKIEALADLPLAWHFIGHLQSNKARQAVGRFDLIHSVDSLKLAAAIDREAARLGKVQDILVQVNIGMEAAKSGIDADRAMDLVKAVGGLAHVRVKGLMTIPPMCASPEEAAPFFAALRMLSERIAAAKLPDVGLAELSMGMSGDFEIAVREGATLVRVGTLLFGERPSRKKEERAG